MNPNVFELKSALRMQIRGELGKISRTERMAASQQACQLLQRRDCWREAKSVLFYVPLNDELDLTPLWQTALAGEKIITIPRYVPSEREYVACGFEGATDSLVRGYFGIPEPAPDRPCFPLNQLDLILVPGVAFDLSGRRLGRGKGYYDRLLLQVRGTKCGVAFDQQILAEIPTEAQDVLLNCILTPTRWLSFGQSAATK